MTTTTVRIPNIDIQLTLDQLKVALRQLQPGERTELARTLIDTDLDLELSQLIDDLYSQPPIDQVSDQEILDEVRAVRRQGV